MTCFRSRWRRDRRPLFKPKTVDPVLVAFNKALADLAHVQDRHLDNIDEHQAAIDAATKARDAETAEHERAGRIRAKFEALLN